MLRAIAHKLYLVCGYAAGAFLAAIAVATLSQIVARQMGRAVEMTELYGFCMAASTFLGLAYTFVNGGHVRVEIVAQLTGGKIKRGVELWCCATGIVITAFAAFQMAKFTLETWRINELSPGLLAIPMWIPQSGVAFGLAVMCIGIIEQTTLVLAGHRPDYETNTDSTAE